VTEAAVTYVSEAMKEAVGRELSRQVSYPIAESDIRRWAVAIYYPEPPPRRFWDAEFAATTASGGIVAPEDFNPFAWMSAFPPGPPPPDGHNDPQNTEKTLGIEPPAVSFMLNGGIEVEYREPMRPGDVITSVARLDSYRERPGRLGIMLLTTLENTWTNQRDELVHRARSTVIRY
jgi:hypothetical protein